MTLSKALRVALLTTLVAPWPALQAQELKYDILKLPAVHSDIAAKSLIYTVQKFGDRIFAGGIRGNILYSDDHGDTWTQAEVPVRSSILDFDFPTTEEGWAVGHEGVILHSADGGKTWVKQYDGIRYAEEGLAFYQTMALEDPENELYPFLVDEMQFAMEQGADKPFFKVKCQRDRRQCNAVGAYGMSVVSFDDGETWIPTLHTTPNDNFYHIFDFAPLPGAHRYFLAGEAGLFMVSELTQTPGKVEGTTRLVNSIPWEGSFFSSVDTADGAIVMGGLRGRMFRTADEGDTWIVVEKPNTSAIVDAIRLPDERLVAVGVAGEVLVSSDNGYTFTRADVGKTGRIFSVSEALGDTLLLAGPKGIMKVTLPR
jgi:photosystem II stability/assembly factor-like uncharacterized protein